MEILLKFCNIIYTAGSTVLLPLLLLILGFWAGVGTELSLRGIFKVSAALIGVSLIINRLGAEMLTFAQLFTARWGFASTVTVNNYQLASAISFSANMALYMLPLSVAINLLLLASHSCRTVNVDLWSYWHMAFTGMMVQVLTGSVLYGFIAAALHCILSLVFADLMSARIEKSTGIAGATMTHGFVIAYAPIVWLVNYLLDRIFPNMREIGFAYIKKRLGFFGEPALWCAVTAGIIAALAGYTVYGVLQFAVLFAALALLLPLLGRFFGEGFSVLLQRLFDKMNTGKRKGRISLGFSVPLGMFDPAVLFISLLLIPFALWLGSLPLFDFVPTDDTAMLIYIAVAAVAFSGGRIGRALLSGVISIAVTLLSGAYLAPLFTRIAQDMDAAKYGDAGLLGTVAGGASPLTTFEVFFSSFGLAGFALLLVFVITMVVVNRNRIAAEHRLFLAESGDTIYPISGDLNHFTHYVSKKKELKAQAKAAAEALPKEEITSK